MSRAPAESTCRLNWTCHTPFTVDTASSDIPMPTGGLPSAIRTGVLGSATSSRCLVAVAVNETHFETDDVAPDDVLIRVERLEGVPDDSVTGLPVAVVHRAQIEG